MRYVTGYTLIEILVVLFIISVVTGVAVLSIHQNEDRNASLLADEISQWLVSIEEEAMLGSSVVSISKESIIEKYPELKRYQIHLSVPNIIVSTNGDVTPFTLAFGKREGKSQYLIVGKPDGTISRA